LDALTRSPKNQTKVFFTITISTLIPTKRPHMKEYVKSSKMEQRSLIDTSEEKYVTIKIPKELIKHWQLEGFFHLHYGVAVRLVISLHGRRCLSISTRVSLLDTNYLCYQNVMIQTILTMLPIWSVIFTIFPNYNVRLKDLTISQRLKVQI